MQEKFLTLRRILCGVRSWGQVANDDIVEEARTLFRDLQLPFARIATFGNYARTSFPNYNFVFRRIFDMIGVPQFGQDFPPLKSKKKREEIVLLWVEFLNYLKWPYINSDGTNFGPEHETRLADLHRRKQQSAAKRKRRTPSPTHTEPCDNQLRRDDDSSAKRRCDRGSIDALMCLILDTRDGAEHFGGAGLGDEHY